tara:strand:- start:365 stop:574 length:210 start_codon:yes stop_codon:yes gene_type:complete
MGNVMCVHFVGFKGDEYTNAVKVWGKPDFYHRLYDTRAEGDFSPEDTVVFANGSENRFKSFSFNDSEVF